MAEAGAVPVIAEEKSTIIPYKMDLVVDVKENGEGTIKINKLVYTTKGDEGTPFASSKDYGQGEGESKIGEAAEGIKNNVMKELFPNDGNNAEEVPAAPEAKEEEKEEKEEKEATSEAQAQEEKEAAAPEVPRDNAQQPLPPPPGNNAVLAQPSASEPAKTLVQDKIPEPEPEPQPQTQPQAPNTKVQWNKTANKNPNYKPRGFDGGTRRKRRVKQTKKHYKRASTRTRRNKPFYFFN
jgi:hypothetical protein